MMKSDIEISNDSNILDIRKILEKINIDETDYNVYGKYKAKINSNILNKFKNNNEGKVILVTAISPTPAGEGKTTTTIGLGDALKKLNKNVIICLREPSLGPVFGIKGGATGGGYSQVVPMDDINLHFNGDLHAITASNNLLSALIDNHIFYGNKLNIDPKKITWKRCLDISDRQLRNIIIGIGSKFNGVTREDSFDITVASEIMAVFCLSNNLEELKENLSKITIGYTYENKPITCKDLNCHGSLVALLKDAFNPNLVQTLEHTPTLIHGGPFANIAHGCNSIIATKIGMKLADFVVTEAGFGADLGAEKFINIKCRKSNIKPSAVVLVATVRALKYHGDCNKEDLDKEDISKLEIGIKNLEKHINNINNVYGLPVVVSINKFFNDTDKEINFIIDFCKKLNIDVSISETFSKGSQGGIDLAQKVLKLLEKDNNFKFTYEDNNTLLEKIEIISSKIYGADSVELSQEARLELKKIEDMGYRNLPICVAKTQYSFSDDQKLLGVAKNFKIKINKIKLCSGAGFIVAIAGNMMTMPGLPQKPLAEIIDIDKTGKITGLF